MLGTVQSFSENTATVKLDAGDVVKALAVNVGAVGSRTTLSVRPERCVVTAKKSAGISSLDARIEELIYLGDHVRCRVMVAGVDDFIVKVPNSAKNTWREVGEDVYIGWETQDCRALNYM
jgi:putative spermidine/putrescine transport system ATP-binding protein